jgi:hypothetical protein
VVKTVIIIHKGKLSLYTPWRHVESGGAALLILNLSIRWRWVVSFTPWLLYPQGKSPCYPLNRRLGGSQERCGSFGEEKNLLLLPWIKPWFLDCPVHSVVTILTMLPMLQLWLVDYVITLSTTTFSTTTNTSILNGSKIIYRSSVPTQFGVV